MQFNYFLFHSSENLEVATEPVWVNHIEIGRYFEKFCETYYVPNSEKEEEYPQDAEVRHQYQVHTKCQRTQEAMEEA